MLQPGPVEKICFKALLKPMLASTGTPVVRMLAKKCCCCVKELRRHSEAALCLAKSWGRVGGSENGDEQEESELGGKHEEGGC
jgi:hypothetical protein